MICVSASLQTLRDPLISTSVAAPIDHSHLQSLLFSSFLKGLEISGASPDLYMGKEEKFLSYKQKTNLVSFNLE